MSARSLSLFEKLANTTGAIYRHHAAQWPRRSALLREIAKKELAVPKQAEWPAIKADFQKVVKTLESGAYKQFTVRESLVYAAVALEISFWFFAGEMIGRRYIFGYLVPSDYVSIETKRKARELKEQEPH